MQECFILGSGNAFNLDARGHTSFLLDRKILIDCGATTLLKIQQFKVDISNLKCILITHFHGDHFSGIPFLLIYFKYILNRTDPIFIIGPEGIKTKFEQLIEINYPELQFPYSIEFIELNKRDSINFQEYKIKSYPITHKKESIGYQILDNHHSFAFTGDTILNQEVFDLLLNIDIGILELSLWKNPNLEVAHVSLEELIQYRDQIHVKQLYFNHLTDELAKEVKTLNQTYKNFGIPLFDGMRILF